MEKYLSIGEVSRLLDIPEHTLRYWQDAGIFSVYQELNNYRKYTIADLLNIAEIAFYRKIGIPVREMEHFSHFSLEDYSKVLTGVGEQLERQIQSLESMQRAVELKQKHIGEIEFLKKVDFSMERVPFSSVTRFQYSDRDKLVRYTQNPSLYVRLIDTEYPDREVRGMIADGLPCQRELIWKKTEDREYAAFLIEELPDEGYASNLLEKLIPIRSLGKTGIILANFLMSEIQDGRKVDYLKGYAEIIRQ